MGWAGGATHKRKPGGLWGAAQAELDQAGVHHNVVVGVEVAVADDAGDTVSPHQQVVGVGGLVGFHLDARRLAPEPSSRSSSSSRGPSPRCCPCLGWEQTMDLGAEIFDRAFSAGPLLPQGSDALALDAPWRLAEVRSAQTGVQIYPPCPPSHTPSPLPTPVSLQGLVLLPGNPSRFLSKRHPSVH